MQHVLNNKLPKNTMQSKMAYEMINELLILDGSSRTNLATFCQTYMEDEAINLMTNSLSKNAIDKTQYPQVTAIEQKCINMIADLWNCGNNFIGTSTVGSSEACMLAGLAMKKRYFNYWEEKNIIKTEKPNLIISSANQICWEKFSVYFDVELKIIDVNTDCKIDLKKAIEAIDENTIGIVAILGITYTGMYDDIFNLDKMLKNYNSKSNYDIYIHVDAASGGLYAPFVQSGLKWDFQLETVISINTSGHKYGLVFPSIGWLIFKDKKYVDNSLLFEVNYLGSKVPTMSLNFSHSASNLISQYYNFIRLGFDGYKDIHQKTKTIAKVISNYFATITNFTVINNGDDLPTICYYLNDSHDKNWNLYDLSDRMMQRWQIPTYPLPNGIIIQRIVCRADLTMEMVDILIDDLNNSIQFLNEKNISLHENENHITSFNHS